MEHHRSVTLTGFTTLRQAAATTVALSACVHVTVCATGVADSSPAIPAQNVMMHEKNNNNHSYYFFYFYYYYYFSIFLFIIIMAKIYYYDDYFFVHNNITMAIGHFIEEML